LWGLFWGPDQFRDLGGTGLNYHEKNSAIQAGHYDLIKKF